VTYPRTFSHIGLSVIDLEQAVDFYTEVLGWYVIMPPTEIVADDSAIGVMCNDVFGENWGSFRIAHLANGGKQRMPVREYYPGEKPYRMVYCEDPFGNLIEIYSHSYELTYAAGAYQSPPEAGRGA
jgi:catechol 2,3-dioxygenase-like lactoylglutathione lyase family enzyme